MSTVKTVKTVKLIPFTLSDICTFVSSTVLYICVQHQNSTRNRHIVIKRTNDMKFSVDFRVPEAYQMPDGTKVQVNKFVHRID